MKLTKTRLKEIIREELSKDNLLEHKGGVPQPGLWLHVVAADIKKTLDVEEVAANEEYTRDLMDALALVEGVREKLFQARGR